MALELINKKDNFELVRDQIAGILALETLAQVALATAASEPDPDDCKLRIFTERSNPWEQFLNDDTDKSPLVNVWYDGSTFDESGSNIVERQKTVGIFNIDCYGYAISEDDGAGHKPGDREAAFEAQKAARLVRNILMAAENTYLQMRGLVWQRWPQAVNIFQPQQNDRPIQNIVAGRLTFRVVFNEFSPQVVGDILEYLAVDVKRAEDGSIYFEADYDYTVI